MTDAAQILPIERRKRAAPRREGYGLFVTDTELAEYLGVPYATILLPAITMLDRDRGSGFPQKIPLWGGRRYLPAVSAWFDASCGLKLALSKSRKVSDDD